LDNPAIRGTIVLDDGQSWLVSSKIPSAREQNRQVTVSLRVPLDNIGICHVQPNDVQLAVYQQSRPEIVKEAEFLGLPNWLACDEECGLAW
jgi:hypothetical protein